MSVNDYNLSINEPDKILTIFHNSPDKIGEEILPTRDAIRSNKFTMVHKFNKY